jgi:putative oxidoreductase
LRIHSWLPHSALNGSNGWTNNLGAREFTANAISAIWRDKRWIGNGWSSLRCLGSSDLEQYAILLVRVSIGLFFAISGANKLFVAGGTKPVYDTLVKAKVPFPRRRLISWRVSSSLRILADRGVSFEPGQRGFIDRYDVATLTSALSTLPKGLSPLSWLDDFLYLPEVLYVLFFIWLICSGPGKFSVDYWLAGKLNIS